MNKVHLYCVVTGTTYDSAFSASLALHFNAGQQLAHATSRIINRIRPLVKHGIIAYRF